MTVTNRDYSMAKGLEPAYAGKDALAEMVPYTRYEHGVVSNTAGYLAPEELLMVKIRGKKPLPMERTPGDDVNLITGRLYSQGLIKKPADIRRLEFSSSKDVTVADLELASVNLFRPKVKGVCGQNSIQAGNLCALKGLFEKRQGMYHSTRATHAAALFSIDGQMLAFGEDVGRHNAFDKAVGQAFNKNILDRADIAVLSSRLALNLVEKASMAGIGILCGFSLATSAALKFAQTRDITLVGRLRENAMNIYTNEWRIV